MSGRSARLVVDLAEQLLGLGFHGDRDWLGGGSVLSVADDIVVALQSAPDAWPNFLAFPDLYRQVRIG